MDADDSELKLNDNLEQPKPPPKDEMSDCPFCARKIPAGVKTCPLCKLDLVEPEPQPQPKNELELQPHDAQIPTGIDARREKKILPTYTPQAAKSNVMGWAFTLLVFAGLGYGGYFLYQKKYVANEATAAAPAQQVQLESQTPLPLPKTVDTPRQKSERELKAAEQAFVTLQGQYQTEADAIDKLKGQLKTLQAKKEYYKAFYAMNAVSSAYARLLTRDDELIHVNEHKSAVESTVAQAQSHVYDAEKYLLERLNQFSKLVPAWNPRPWIDIAEVRDRNGLQVYVEAMKKMMDNWRTQLATDAKATQQALDEKQKLLPDLEAKIKEAENVIGNLKGTLKAPEAAAPGG